MDTTEHKTPEQVAYDKNYRSKSLYHSFMGSLYSGLAGASFFGLLTKIVDLLVKQTVIPAPGATPDPAFTPMTWAVMGGAMLAGAAFTYLAQREWTSLREVQDDNLARKNAQCMAQQHGVALTQAQAVSVTQDVGKNFEENQRNDGKSWEQALAVKAQANAHIVTVRS